MNRRRALKRISGLLGATSALIVGAPGVGFVVDMLRRRPNKAIVQRVSRLRDLAPGKPVQVSVVGSRRDAWTSHPDGVIGRVWLVRPKADPAADKQPTVTALAATCPHLGCTIQLDPQGQRFVCPCHRAVFGLDGQRLGQANHAPRGMDSLECRLVKDRDANDWWVEVTYEKFEQGLTTKVCKV